ncbi:hypothetical protein ACS0TY_017394 [Phlomoides rotata]
MLNDPLKDDLQSVALNQADDENFIDSVNPSQAWSNWRDNLAHEMYSNCQGLLECGSTDQVLAKLRNRNDKERRGWSLREEHVLAEALKKIVREGWRSENGFNTGYLGLLHGYMKQVFPNTDIKPETHITSCLTVWKKNYHSLFEILKHTGVGLDSTTKMVEATDEQCEGFVKDESESPGGYAQTGESSNVGKTSSGRKRKAPNTPDPFVSVVQGKEANLLICLDDGYTNSARKKLCAISLITHITEYIDVFFSLPGDDRLEWVCMVLNGDI